MKLTALIPLILCCALPTFADAPVSQDAAFPDDLLLDEDTEEEEEEDDFGEPAPEKKEEHIPEWLAELSNLPREKRDEYIAYFTQAKQALAAGDWIGCDAAMNSCEFIFNKNPNIHNLRVVCYIEQKRLDDATEAMEKAKKEMPDDPATIVNIATLHMAKKDFRSCITEMTAVLEDRQYNISTEVRDILTFRIFLCRLMLGELSEAQDLVAELTPISDTPLFYFSRAAVCLYLKDAEGARTDLQSAANIFSQSGLLIPYQRALLSCDLTQAKH